MKFQVSVTESDDGSYLAECPQLDAQSKGLSAANALDKLRDEVRYRLEYCPCSGIEEDCIQFEVSGL